MPGTLTEDATDMTEKQTPPAAETGDVPPHRYTAAVAGQIEARWQDRWESEGTFQAPNPEGALAPQGQDEGWHNAGHDKLYVLDMFPYPSGAGLHVGHPLGYIGTDVYGRYKRMAGYNVLHALGFDAFGLPAEQYAVQTGQHPRKTTEANIINMRRQLRRLGLAHDARRSVATTDVEFYRWTQWIFLQVFNSWYDQDVQKARPVAELIAEFESGTRPVPGEKNWADLDEVARREIIDGYRLAYRSDAPVNWCPGLGTVLANEEITPDGRSHVGNFPVFKRNLTQWMMRITAYADRLTDDLAGLDWPESVKQMQRNWIGRSSGARVDFPVAAGAHAAKPGPVTVFTTRPDTLFGATYMVLAPEHPLVDALVDLSDDAWPDGTPEAWTGGEVTPAEAVAAYRRSAQSKSDVERQTEGKDKTGVFTGAYAINPVNGERIPVFVADYVLMGYGTGAIMAVPAQDERDWEFATKFGVPIVRTVQTPEGWDVNQPFTGDGPAINSANDTVSLNGLGVAEAKETMIAWLAANGHGERTITYKLRDWLFSRQRYWGEPFPIVYDETGLPIALPESMLPIELPEVDDYSPRSFEADDETSTPEPPLGRVAEWSTVTLDLGDGEKQYRRELNVMPQWAGSCWYEIRYLDPDNTERFVDPAAERYWMGPRGEGHPGGVDLYVGGVEHAVLHLLYSRFWQKVLFDLGHVSASEPFYRLFNQGMIQAWAYTDERGGYVPAAEVREEGEGKNARYFYGDAEVNREYGKMGKSLKNSVAPDEMCEIYGADTLRVYEMSMGPLDVSRPWETRAVVGSHRFLQRIWRNLIDEHTGELRVTAAPASDDTRRALHRAIDGIHGDMDGLRFNTAIAKLIELNNHLTSVTTDGTPREVADPLVLMLAPFAPHLAEELWSRLGHGETLAYQPFPIADPALLTGDTAEYPVQVNGKVRGKVTVPADADEAAVREAALADPKVAQYVGDKTPRKVIVVPGRIVTIVV
ncbi:MAG: leucine--tRNA ligase [Actinomycetia bacterium]|nr:leucine--tRNA ligase [Actinomycetes bacterium]